MTVKELMKHLSTFPQDLPVLVDGYEGGLDEVGHIEKVQVEFNVNDKNWLGPHEEVSKKRPNAVKISRYEK